MTQGYSSVDFCRKLLSGSVHSLSQHISRACPCRSRSSTYWEALIPLYHYLARKFAPQQSVRPRLELLFKKNKVHLPCHLAAQHESRWTYFILRVLQQSSFIKTPRTLLTMPAQRACWCAFFWTVSSAGRSSDGLCSSA